LIESLNHLLFTFKWQTGEHYNADVIEIIAPTPAAMILQSLLLTPAAMRAMLKLCDNFANYFSIIFNA